MAKLLLISFIALKLGLHDIMMLILILTCISLLKMFDVLLFLKDILFNNDVTVYSFAFRHKL